jgi:hypothetical protein
MRSTKLIRMAVLTTVLAFGAVTLTPAPQAAADGIEGIRPNKKPAPKRKPKPVAPKVTPAPVPPPVIFEPVRPTGPKELTLPSSFFEGSGGVGVNITGGGGGIVVVTGAHGVSSGGGFSGFAGRSAFFSNVSGGGKGC